jgi:hypothetical protein
MQNVEMTVDGYILTLRVDLTKEVGSSPKGKAGQHILSLCGE